MSTGSSSAISQMNSELKYCSDFFHSLETEESKSLHEMHPNHKHTAAPQINGCITVAPRTLCNLRLLKSTSRSLPKPATHCLRQQYIKPHQKDKGNKDDIPVLIHHREAGEGAEVRGWAKVYLYL